MGWPVAGWFSRPAEAGTGFREGIAGCRSSGSPFCGAGDGFGSGLTEVRESLSYVPAGSSAEPVPEVSPVVPPDSLVGTGKTEFVQSTSDSPPE